MAKYAFEAMTSGHHHAAIRDDGVGLHPAFDVPEFLAQVASDPGSGGFGKEQCVRAAAAFGFAILFKQMEDELGEPTLLQPYCGVVRKPGDAHLRPRFVAEAF